MKIDYDQIKIYLQTFEGNEQPTISTLKVFEKLDYNHKNNDDCQQVWFYLKLLNDQGLLECISQNVVDKNNLGFSFTGSGQFIISIRNFRLTMLGHQTLESMTNQNIWLKIKEPLGKIGIEGLKQIPSLAIKLIEDYLKNPTQ